MRIDCPHCNGTGEQTIPVTSYENGVKKESSFKMPCDFCKSTGRTMQAAVDAAKKAHDEFWCSCAKQDPYPTVHLNHGGGVNWVECRQCHKCLQVG